MVPAPRAPYDRGVNEAPEELVEVEARAGRRPSPEESLAPVSAATDRGPKSGVGLCLSGGGSRAMLFHAGALLRLDELGLLGTVDRFSSVSGGSIVNGLLAVRWGDLAFDTTGRSGRVMDVIVEPLRNLAHQSIDVPAWIVGTLNPFSTPARTFADQLDRHLYDGATFDRLVKAPRFVINATNLATGVLFRFSQPFMGDWLIGRVADPYVRVSTAVAASGAFPPFFSPLRLDLRKATWMDDDATLGTPEFRSEPALGDGGIYDNLGLETAWKRCRTLLVSDGGGTLGYDPRPPGGFVFQTLRVMNVIDRQVRALRKRLLIDGFEMGIRDGAYWGIRADIARFRAPGTLPCPLEATTRLANLPTRLNRMPDRTIERLVNWGYAIADAGLRTHVVRDAPPPAGFPFPAAGVG